MKVIDAIQSMAYRPGLRKEAGSINACIFLSLVLGEAKAGNWVHIPTSRAEEVTGLTYKEQQAARAKLVKRGFLVERYDRLNHELYFAICLERLGT